MKKGDKLQPKQEAFVREYLIDLNASAAYRRAGYKSGNPDVCGPRMLGNVGVASAIQRALDERAERTKISADQVLARLWEEANRKGPGSTHAARIRALELVGRNLGMRFTEVHELSGPNGGPIETTDAKERLLGKLRR